MVTGNTPDACLRNRSIGLSPPRLLYGRAAKDSSGVNGTFDENAGVLSGCTAGFPYDIDMSAVSQVLYLIDYAYTY